MNNREDFDYVEISEELKAKLHRRMAKNNFAVFIGARITRMYKGYSECELDVKEELNNAYGRMQGGCIFTLADVTTGNAAATYDVKAFTSSSDFNFLSPAVNTSKIIAVAKIIKPGRSLMVFGAEVFDENKKLIAYGTFTYFSTGENIDI